MSGERPLIVTSHVSPRGAAPSAALRDTFWIAAAESLALPTGLITSAFLTRQLGPADYGLLSLSAGCVTWVQWTIASLWAGPSIRAVSTADPPHEVAEAFLRVYAWSGAAAFLILLLAAGSLAALFHHPAVEPALRWYACDVLLFSLTHGYRSVHAGLGLHRGRAYGSAARWLVRLLLILLLVGAGFGVTGAIAANMLSTLADLGVNRFRSPVRLRFRGVVPWTLLRESGVLALVGVLMRLVERMDLFFLSAMGVASHLVGGYGAAQNLFVLAGIVTGSASPVLLSSMARALREGETELARRSGTLALRVALCLMPPAFAASLFGEDLARLIFGGRFAFIGPAMGLLVSAIPAVILLAFLQCILIAHNAVRPLIGITLGASLAGTAAYLWAIPRWAERGAASVTLAMTIAACLATAAVAQRLRFPLPYGTALRSVLSALGVALLVAWGRPHGMTWVHAAFAAVVLLGLSGEIQPAERILIRDQWRRWRTR